MTAPRPPDDHRSRTANLSSSDKPADAACYPRNAIAQCVGASAACASVLGAGCVETSHTSVAVCANFGDLVPQDSPSSMLRSIGWPDRPRVLRNSAMRGLHTAEHVVLARTVACVLAVGALATAAGCGEHPAPRAAPPTVFPPPVSVSAHPAPTYPGPGCWSVTRTDDHDPDAVLTAVACTLYTYSPAEDDSAATAFDRARGLPSRSYQQGVAASRTGLARYTVATWQQWVQSRAIVAASAVVAPDDHPPDTDTHHARVVTVTQSVHPQPGGTNTSRPPESQPAPIVLYMAAARSNPADGWAVTMIAPR